ncbi:VPA1337 family putative T3SS effector [Vibrio mimicus]
MFKKWDHIEWLQNELQTINMKNEHDSLKRLFMRREGLRSKIESTFYDASVIKQDLDEVMFEIQQTQLEKKNLEKRKDRLTEMREQLMYE